MQSWRRLLNLLERHIKYVAAEQQDVCGTGAWPSISIMCSHIRRVEMPRPHSVSYIGALIHASRAVVNNDRNSLYELSIPVLLTPEVTYP